MKKTSILLLIQLSLIPLLCFTNQNAAKEEAVININLDETIDRIYYSAFFSDYEIILLENNNESVIGKISDIKFYKNKFYIHDSRYSKSVFIFSLQGKFLKKIGSLGKGPGEYISTLDFEIDTLNNELIILSYEKLLIYNLEGEYKKTINLEFPANDLICFGNRIYLYPFASIKEHHPDFCAFSINRKGKDLKTYLKFPLHKKGYFRDAIIGTPGFLFRTHNAVRLTIPFCDTIFTLYEEHASPYIIFESKDLLNNEYMSSNFENSENQYMGINKLLESKKITAYHHYGENNSLIYLNYFISHNRYYLLYNKHTTKTFCSSIFVDDLTNIYPILINLTNQYMIGYLPLRYVHKYKDDILKLLNESDKKNFIDDLSGSKFNPIVFLFKLKQ